MTTHNAAILVLVSLAALPPAEPSFEIVFLVDQADGNGLGTARAKPVASVADAQALRTATEISAATLAAVEAAFAQRSDGRILGRMWIARVDTGGSETYAQGYAAAAAFIGADAYCFVADTRTAAVQKAIADAVEAGASGRHVFIPVVSDGDWLTAGLPAAWSGAATYKRTWPIYHQTSAQVDDLRWAARLFAISPQRRSSPGALDLQGGAATVVATAAARLALLDNGCNVALPLGASGQTPRFVLNGTALSGDPLSDIVSADWLDRRVAALVAAEWAALAARNEKWTVTIDGFTRARALLERALVEGVEAGHFVPGQIVTDQIAPTQADRDAALVRASGQAQIGRSVQRFEVSIDLLNAPVSG